MTRRVPPYFDALIQGFERGLVGRRVHLGHWDHPVASGERGPPGSFDDAQRRLDEALLDLAGVADGQSVLDVGCGLGATLASVDARRRRMTLVGINIDRRQLALCTGLEPNAGTDLAWLQGDACALPFADAVFDHVLCVEAMFHFDSRRAFFCEAARVLRAGGILTLSDIVLTEAGRRPGAVRPGLEADLVEGYGPWPDLRGADADHVVLGRAAGLTRTAVVDATANTLPSYRYTLPADLRDWRALDDPMLRAGVALRELHRDGRLAYLYMRFEKVAGGPV